MVLQGLAKEELSVSSVSTLKRICRECRLDLGPFAQDILSVSQVRPRKCGFLIKILGYIILLGQFGCDYYNIQGNTVMYNFHFFSIYRRSWLKKYIRCVNSRRKPCSARTLRGRFVRCAMCVNLFVCLCAEQPVHVADAGSRFPAVGFAFR